MHEFNYCQTCIHIIVISVLLVISYIEIYNERISKQGKLQDLIKIPQIYVTSCNVFSVHYWKYDRLYRRMHTHTCTWACTHNLYYSTLMWSPHTANKIFMYYRIMSCIPQHKCALNTQNVLMYSLVLRLHLPNDTKSKRRAWHMIIWEVEPGNEATYISTRGEVTLIEPYQESLFPVLCMGMENGSCYISRAQTVP